MFGGLLSRLQGAGALPTIEHGAFAQAVEEKAAAIVDVREPHEYAAGHVPGAVNMPLSRFLPAALPKGQPVVLICQAGGRSAKALQQALDSGCRDICHYALGTGGWKASGGALEH
ncbi:MAG: rhodanese-like domain-containing protein [Methylocystis sp.]